VATTTVPAKATRAIARRRARHTQRNPRAWMLGVAAWAIGLLFVAPVLWMLLTSLHTEADAASNPPAVAAKLTFSGYQEFFDSNPWPALINSATAAIGSTLLVLALATPAAYALSIKPVRKWTDAMFFFLSTKFLPVVAALLPVYLIAKNLHLLDNIVALVVIYASMNLPIAVWMMRSFLAELPREMIEAAEMDGARLPTILRRIILPVSAPGLAATSLICFIFAWNELMFARVLTSTVASTSPVFLTGFITSEGLFLAKLCAAAMIVSLPVLIAGFAAQDKLVQGLSMGAVK
jgi:sorbitol/mannitol transport system permease protein